MSRTRGTFEAAPNVSLTSVQVEQTPPPRHGCGGSSENIYPLPALLCPDIFLGIWTFVVTAAIARAGGTRLQQTDTSVPVLLCRQGKPQGYPLPCLPATTLPPQRSLPTLAERLQEFTKGLISILSNLCIGPLVWSCQYFGTLHMTKSLLTGLKTEKGALEWAEGDSPCPRGSPPLHARAHPAHFIP